MRTAEDFKVNLKGAIVACMGIRAEIDKILYAEYWDRYGWDIEFIDSKGNYRHWKQNEDGGELQRPLPKKHFIVGQTNGAYYDDEGKKHLLDYYGTDCTDLFKKYGYSI